jgi:hypothetical protein
MVNYVDYRNLLLNVLIINLLSKQYCFFCIIIIYIEKMNSINAKKDYIQENELLIAKINMLYNEKTELARKYAALMNNYLKLQNLYLKI